VKFFSGFLVLLCITGIHCSNKEAGKNKVMTIEGFIIRDALGNQLSVVGNAGVDWQIQEWNQLTAKEQSYLSFSDNINMSNTVTSTVNPPVSFPNPFRGLEGNSVWFNSADSAKVKLAVVNEYGEVMQTHALKIKGNKVIRLDFSDAVKYPPGLALRYFFSFSSSTQQNFKAGYGDVKLCDNPVNYLQCF
jgi:hypothetical protein